MRTEEETLPPSLSQTLTMIAGSRLAFVACKRARAHFAAIGCVKLLVNVARRWGNDNFSEDAGGKTVVFFKTIE